MLWKTKGMNQDLSVSAFNPEFSFENRNLRLSTNEGNTLMSWVNEKGTMGLGLSNAEYWSKANNSNTYKEPSDSSSWSHHAAGTEAVLIAGTPIGTAIIEHQLILFSVEEGTSHIYALTYADNTKTNMYVRVLYSGDLGLQADKPLQTLVSYESKRVQKVYWTDGVKQPRVINVAMDSFEENNTQFDFVPTLALKETVTVEKQHGANGMFAPGVIQYAFTYYRKYGQESCIFYITPLLYVSYKDRGASPEDKVENAFQITINNPDNSFDFLRIYSIQRTSRDATPICKRVQDISLETNPSKVSYIDTGINGDTVDPTELLYKGGESITAETLEQKDNTLFLGNLGISRIMVESSLKDDVKSQIDLDSSSTREIKPMQVSSGSYFYYNQLTSNGNEERFSGMTVPCGGFKTGDWYRCGVQFQYKTGKWSDPIWVEDKQILGKYKDESATITLPNISGSLPKTLVQSLKEAEYRKVRPVVVFPNMLDRDTLCQGVAAPTVFTAQHRDTDNDLYAQSSWFFRPYCQNDNTEGEGTTVLSPFSADGNPVDGSYTGRPTLRYTSRQMENDVPDTDVTIFNPQYIRQVEIEGQFSDANKFRVDRTMRTLHSPDVEFDDQLALVNFIGVEYRQVGTATFTNTLSDIDIQTESPTVSSIGGGLIHKAFSSNGPKGIVSGLFYDDCLVDDNVNGTGEVRSWPKQRTGAKFLIYPWQGNGSLNNDFLRPADKGTPSSVLKKKVISNLRYTTTAFVPTSILDITKVSMDTPQLFASDEPTILKFNDNIYKGNIDTMLVPDDMDGVYFAFNAWNNGWLESEDPTPFDSVEWCKTCNNNNVGQASWRGIRKWFNNLGYWKFWEHGDDEIGETFIDLLLKKLPVRIKYKTTPHLVGSFSNLTEGNYQLPIVEIVRKTTEGTRFGGKSIDALKENIWIPCGEPVSLDKTDAEGNVPFFYDYGDTYFQRYDCLKTYAFTREDPNQIVEIGSFMLETRVNIDGRYDRNRGQGNNLNMSPQNFNLINPIYSQVDNFFSYRIQDDSFYESNSYPNQITWSKTKTSDADVDLWTNMTMASVLELDGDKGKVNKLVRLNDQLICFQDSGISQILYNENTQISTTQGVPIEIANSGKVQGKRYLSNTVGCSNKWSIVQTPVGIYFMDSNDKSIYLFNDQLQNISQQGMNTWCKDKIPSQEKVWTPKDFESFIGYYDRMNQDVLFINSEVALAWSEKLNVFTSFYDYGHVPYFCNLDDTGVWINYASHEEESPNEASHLVWETSLWKHQAGDYCKFFDEQMPYWMTLVGNPEPQTDKIFTNIEFRASVEKEGVVGDSGGGDTPINVFDTTFDFTFRISGGSGPIDPNAKFTPYLPFDYIETWDEYQHGIADLSWKNGRGTMQHHLSDSSAHLARKFRIWRCDIPRDNYPLTNGKDVDSERGIARYYRKPQDRMRNPWLYIKLMKEAPLTGKSSHRAEIHDFLMTYFN